MSGEAMNAVQAAVYTALTGASAVTDLVSTRIHDQVPEGLTTFPFIEFGDPTAQPFDATVMRGQTEDLTLHVWSRTGGRKQTQQVLAAIYATLHRQALTITGHSHVQTIHRFQTVLADPDGETWHGLTRFEITTQAA